jgi:hypothetical protein
LQLRIGCRSASRGSHHADGLADFFFLSPFEEHIMRVRRMLSAAVALLALFACGTARAELFSFYLGVDGRPTIPSGVYAGLDNPNHGRLTLLAYPGDHDQPMGAHYHAIGAYSYAGDLPVPTVNDTNANNRIPEIHTAQPPLSLLPGEGIYAGKYVSGVASGEHYSDLTMRGAADMSSYAEPSVEYYLFNSSGGVWKGSLGAANVAIELVSISPGLHIGLDTELDILSQPGDRFTLGVEDAIDFTPVFWTDEASNDTLSASFRLVDVNVADGYQPLGSSGTFHVDVTAVPEPGSVALLLCGLAPLWAAVRRKKGRC